jgi:hypothetical protein
MHEHTKQAVAADFHDTWSQASTALDLLEKHQPHRGPHRIVPATVTLEWQDGEAP